MVRVLRPAAGSRMPSARTFERNFVASLEPAVTVESVPAAAWLSPIVDAARTDPYSGGRRAFAEATAGYDFVCPDFQATGLIPLLLQQRNAGDCRVRLLLIAHAPAVLPFEWALLWPLLRAGDLIIVPSRSALEVLVGLAPPLAAFAHVIPHPVPPLPRSGTRRPGSVVALTRIHPWKLLHREIEAVAELRAVGLHRLSLRIAGPLADPGGSSPGRYARSLAAKIERLGLGGCVELVGEIKRDRAKARFLGEAALLVNLSVTVEESLGKAAAEALGCGVPVLGTRWDGLPETIGAAGACVAVRDEGFGMDVAPAAVADSMRRIMEKPPAPDACREQAERFRPARVRSAYGRLLARAREALPDSRPAVGPHQHELRGAPPDGLLAVTAPLTQFGWSELFELHAGSAQRQLAAIAGRRAGRPGECDELRALLINAVRRPVGRQMAGLTPGAPAETVGDTPHPGRAGALPDRVAAAATDRATLSSKITCLGFLAERGRIAELERALAQLREPCADIPAVQYLRVELLRLRNGREDALRLALSADRAELRGELAGLLMRQLAVLATELERPAAALPTLRRWLARHPDGPDSGPVWLDRSRLAISHEPPLLGEARDAAAHARGLLGETPELNALGLRLADRTAVASDAAGQPATTSPVR